MASSETRLDNCLRRLPRLLADLREREGVWTEYDSADGPRHRRFRDDQVITDAIAALVLLAETVEECRG